jgi:hypothetical protein
MLLQPAPNAICTKSAVSRLPPRQITSTSGPAAMRASNAKPTRATTDRSDKPDRPSAAALSPACANGSSRAPAQAPVQAWYHPASADEVLRKAGQDQEILFNIFEPNSV